MLLFRSEEHVDRWCNQWKLARGAVMPLETAWRLAQGWFAGRLDANWQRKTVDEAHALFASLGLTSDFWKMA